jgi:ATP-dependent Clp protease ATP-binding subunit ClpA
MLGIARGESLAARALRECGAPYESLIDAYERIRAKWEEEQPREERAWPKLNPAAYAFLGRAEGFAAAMGSRTIEPEHALLSLLWQPYSVQSGMLRELGTSRTRVQQALGHLGASVPAIDPPPEDDRPWGQRVWFPAEKWDVVLSQVPSRLPENSPFGPAPERLCRLGW